MRIRVLPLLTWFGLVAGLGLLAAPASAVTIDWVLVGDAGNAPDTLSSNCFSASCGAVADAFRISRYEVTNAQYAELLNAKAGSDPLALYSTDMATYGGITRSGSPGSYTYAVKAGWEDKPVNYVSFYDAMRFTNWLHNGQGSGDTETGAYTLLGGTATPSNGYTVTRNPGAIAFLPSENEWYKAAYYDGLSATYFDYPAGTNTQTGCVAPGAAPNTANCDNAVGNVTDVGAYAGSASPYGTFDQGGNVWEWNEQIVSGPRRGIRGGGWGYDAGYLAASYGGVGYPPYEDGDVGFRVASPVPEPGTMLLGMTVMTCLAGLSWKRRSS
ncbi:MAG: SUMF1/EgtB/PvdO family nonheme iron enzyme [Deltaproteobacteria bacterium]|nr:SUMF1/EgtB/PvdO family nonheme iron enzyme [Deltaproteobacteria bacterium]